MKKVLLISVATLFLCLVLAVPVLFYFYKNDIRVIVEQKIDDQINGTVTFDDLGLSFLTDFPNLTLELRNVVVMGKGNFQTDTLAQIPEFGLEVKTSSLLFGKQIEIKSIHLLKPVIHLDVLKNGEANYFSVVETNNVRHKNTEADSSSSYLALDQITMEDGTVVYNDLSMQLYMAMDHLAFSGKGDFQKNIFDLETKAKCNALTLDYNGVHYFRKKHVSVDMIMEMNLDKNLITFKENDIHINHFRFDLEGTLAILTDGFGVDMKFKTKETAFKNLLSLVPGIYMEDFNQIKTDGKVGFDGFVRGKYSENSFPKFMVAVNVEDAMFKIDSLPSPVTNIQLDLIIKNEAGILDSTSFDLRKFHLDMMNHPIHGRLKVKGYEHFEIDADILADVELADLEKMYPIKGLDLQGKLNAEIKAKGKYNLLSLRDSSGKQEIPRFHVNMKLKDGKLKYDHLPTPIENIQFHALIDNTSGVLENTVADIKSLHLDMGKNPVHGTIKISGFNVYDISADLKAKIDLADLEKMYPIESIQMKGLLDLDLKSNGIYNPAMKKFPMIDANLNITNGYLKSSESPDAMENIHFITEAVNTTGKMSDTQLSIKQLTYTMEGEPFTAHGSISDLDNYNFDLDIKGVIDLAKVTKIYPVKDMQIKGLVETDVEVKGSLTDVENGHYEKIASNGTVEIKGLELKSSQLKKTFFVSDAFFTFTPLKIIMSKFQGKIGKSSLSITGDLTDYMALFTRTNDLITGDLKVVCDTLDLNEWYSEKLAASASKQTVVPVINTSVATSVKTAWAVPANLDFTFDSDIGYVIFQDMKISKLDGEIRIKDQTLTMNETGFNSLNAGFHVNGDYVTRDLNHPYFDFELNIQELDINKAYKEIKLVRDMAPAAANTFGQLSVSYKLRGELSGDMSLKTETLAGGGEVRIANAKIDGMKIFEEISKAAKKDDLNNPHLKDFVIKTEIKDNKIFVKPFSIKVSGLNTEIEGVNEIKGALNFIVRIELLPIEKLRIPFHVTGTYDNPKVMLGKGHHLPN